MTPTQPSRACTDSKISPRRRCDKCRSWELRHEDFVGGVMLMLGKCHEPQRRYMTGLDAGFESCDYFQPCEPFDGTTPTNKGARA